MCQLLFKKVTYPEMMRRDKLLIRQDKSLWQEKKNELKSNQKYLVHSRKLG